MTDPRAARTVSSMPPTSVRADGPEPPTRLACRLAHPTHGAAAGLPGAAYPLDVLPAGSALPVATSHAVEVPPPGPASPAAGASYPPGTWSSPARPAGTPNGYLRIGDRERQAVADELRAHFTAGRIDVDEFSARLDEVWAATTVTDLWTALRQLPPVPGQTRPWDVPPAGWSGRPPWTPTSHPPRRSVAYTVARAHLHTYVMVAALLVAIWLLTTPGGYFWPIWPLLFWGWFVFVHHRTTRKWENRRTRRA
jgi:hypothetical protein